MKKIKFYLFGRNQKLFIVNRKYILKKIFNFNYTFVRQNLPGNFAISLQQMLNYSHIGHWAHLCNTSWPADKYVHRVIWLVESMGVCDNSNMGVSNVRLFISTKYSPIFIPLFHLSFHSFPLFILISSFHVIILSN